MKVKVNAKLVKGMKKFGSEWELVMRVDVDVEPDHLYRLVPLLHGHELLLLPLPGCLGGPWYKKTSKENLNVKLFT